MKLYEIHLPELKLSIMHFKMSRSRMNWLPWVVLQASGTRTVSTLWSLVNVSSTILIHEFIILSVDQWFNACTVVRSGDFRVSGRTGLFFGPNQSFLFLSNQ